MNLEHSKRLGNLIVKVITQDWKKCLAKSGEMILESDFDLSP